MIDQSSDPQGLYARVVGGFRLARAVWLAARFRLADVIGAGPASAAKIARDTETDPDAMHRLLNALTAAGLFRLEGDGRYGLTSASELLRLDHPQSQRGLIEVMLGGEFYEAWGEIETTLRTGQTAFDVRYGASLFDYYTAHPRAGRAFAEAMTGITHAFEAAVLEADPFPAFRFAVDVGGSQGSLLRRLLERNVEARGVVFDLPEVIAGLFEDGRDDLGARISGVGGNFFQTVPPGGDLYLLKLILHDWDDERAETILRRVREAVRPDGWVAIVEMVLPETPVEHLGWLMDLSMLVVTGGRERTAGAYANLLERTGWRLARLIPTRSPLSVVLASPAP